MVPRRVPSFSAARGNPGLASRPENPATWWSVPVAIAASARVALGIRSFQPTASVSFSFAG